MLSSHSFSVFLEENYYEPSAVLCAAEKMVKNDRHKPRAPGAYRPLGIQKGKQTIRIQFFAR